MPRKSLAEAVLSESKRLEKSEQSDGVYLVVYDFNLTFRKSIPEKFYKNLSRIMSHKKCKFIQKSVILCEGISTAFAVARLARYYGAEVKVYKVLPMNL